MPTNPKQMIRRTFHAVGGLRAVRYLNRKQVRILMYHRFTPSGAAAVQLRNQCSYVARRYRVVSLSAVIRAFHGQELLPDNATVITVDDGYLDFFEVAYPILRAHGLAATVFLVTDFLDGKDWLWIDKVRYCIQKTRVPRLDLELPNNETLSFELSNDSRRDSAASMINQSAKTLPNQARLALIRELSERTETEIPEAAPREYASLTWGAVRAMSEDGIEFGAHTKTHPILPQVESDAVLEQEILGSKTRIEEELSTQCKHFCYPNGDFDERTVNAIKKAQFESSVTVQNGLNPMNTDPFLLKRIGVEPYFPDVNFRHYIAGSLREMIRAL